MHELGIMCNIVERVLEVVKSNRLSEVEAIVLSVGEQSGVVPQYLHSCYPAAVDATILENTLLEINVVQANAVCKSCGKTFGLTENEAVCPRCESEDFDIVSGTEFILKEIRAR